MTIKTKLLFVFIIVLSVFLRFYRLDSIPPSLYTDEVDQGYNAYSLIKTGTDEHGAVWPVSLRSFGDWKPPMQTYLMIPFMLILGPNEWSVRLPSAILGILGIFLAFSIAKLLFNNNRLTLLSAFILSISPWHLFQSRSAMLVMVALFFFEIGIYGFLKYLKKYKFRFLLLSVIGFSFSIYSYYGLRLIVPLTVFALILWRRSDLFSKWKPVLIGGIFGILLLLPLLVSGLKEKDVLFGRARTVSIFYDRGVELKQWELQTQDFGSTAFILTKLLHNKVFLYGRDIIRRYLSHFDGEYLFLKGDGAFPFQVPNSGILNFSDIFLIPLGLYFLFRKKVKKQIVLWIWLVISIIPASLTFQTPASNRTFDAVVPFAFLSAFGMVYLLKYKSTLQKKLIISIVFITCFYSFSFFLNAYFVRVSNDYGNIWGYGWKEAMQYVYSLKNRYNTIYISSNNGMPYIYYAFYNQIDPKLIQKKMIRPYISNEFGFEPVDSFKNLYFYKNQTFKEIRESGERNILIVLPSGEDDTTGSPVRQIKNPNGKSAIDIYSL